MHTCNTRVLYWNVLLHRTSAQESEASFSSQNRPRKTSEVSQEPREEQEYPAQEPATLKEKALEVLDKMDFLDVFKTTSILPRPEQALESCREDTSALLTLSCALLVLAVLLS